MITTDNSEPIAWLHDRMPAILCNEAEVKAWLGEGDAAEAGGPSLDKVRGQRG